MKHLSPISGISVNKNYIATAGYDNKVILWDRVSFEAIAQGVHDHLVNQCEFSRCGKFLVTSSSDYSARLWQLPEMKLVKVLNNHTDDVECATFDINSNFIAVASRDKTISIHGINDNSVKVLSGHEAAVLSVIFTNETLISCSDDGTMRKWNLADNTNEILIKSDFQTDTVAIGKCLTFAGDDEGVIHIISEKNIQSIKAHSSGIKRLYAFNGGQTLVSTSYDRQCRLWRVIGDLLEEIHSVILPDIVWPRSCAVYEGIIYFGTFGSSYAAYDYLEQKWYLEHIEHSNGINAIGLYNNSIYSIGDSGILRQNNVLVYESQVLSNFITQFENKILIGGQNGLVINTTDNLKGFEYLAPLNIAKVEGNKLFIGTYTGDVLIFDSLTKKPQIINLHNNAIKDMVLINNKYIITVCANGEICRYNIISRDKQIIAGHSSIINSCDTLDENNFVTVGRDKKLKIWNVESLCCVKEIDTLHTHSIKSVAVDSDGRNIATGSYNGTVYVLNLASYNWTKKRVTASGISCLEYDAANNQFLAASYDGNIYPIVIEKSL